VLAERSQTNPENSCRNIWLWRLVAWFLGAAATVAAFHLPLSIGYPTSMLAFSIFAFYWLSMELRVPSSAWQFLGRFGSASYSLYLIHAVVFGGIADYLKLPLAGTLMLAGMAVAVATYIFYKIVEAPSHLLARWSANNVPDFVFGRRIVI
jgi:peptidoglycan/LPS O-acetylase OafA/YrhL